MKVEVGRGKSSELLEGDLEKGMYESWRKERNTEKPTGRGKDLAEQRRKKWT